MLNNTTLTPKNLEPPRDFYTSKSWPREYFYPILETALHLKEYRFTREAALQWLVSYPGDLPIELFLGWALFGEGKINQANRVAIKLCLRDVEYLGAQELLKLTRAATGDKIDPDSDTITPPLGQKAKKNTFIASNALQEAQKALTAKDLPKAEKHIHLALAAEPDSSLTALTHLRILAENHDTPQQAIQSLAQNFHLRWPECIQFMLLLADSLIHSGDQDQAVALLHKAAGYDITGQVSKRLWGENHPYITLWPMSMNAVISIPIPAGVTAALGWNLLESGFHIDKQVELKDSVRESDHLQTGTPDHGATLPADFETTSIQTGDVDKNSAALSDDVPESLRSVKAELEGVGKRLKKSSLGDFDGRYPTYVVFSTRAGLQQKYGRAGFAMLDAAMQELADVIRNNPNWGAIVYYADDPACAAAYGTKPAQMGDAWSLKLSLADLDEALAKKGAMIGALLIVGGPLIVPFHNLPNPTDDSDADVPSDNPYATRDENYFIPEWPVGRLPDEAGANSAHLLGQLQSLTAFHKNNKSTLSWWEKFRVWFSSLWMFSRQSSQKSFGYSAEVWHKASLRIFQQIGSPKEMVTSPPIDLTARDKKMELHMSGDLGFFNLHGLIDTNEWYGHRDPSNGSSGPDYPVALRTKDILNGGRTPQIIFSEACYGAHINEKTSETSLALKFLDSGCRALVGSTVLSYGSVSTPLNAADLLGLAFWKNLNDGFPVGDALRRAKISLAREMHKRQGYLDGEDQKTLISFVLYGDPLAHLVKNKTVYENIIGSKQKQVFVRSLEQSPDVKTVCDRIDTPGGSDPIPEEVLTHIKRVVNQYLPGMQGAQVTMSHEHLDCACKGHSCPTGQFGAKSHPQVKPDRRVVTLSKSITFEQNIHPVYARLTLDQKGKVVKIAVSR